jgi:hypothetical protein
MDDVGISYSHLAFDWHLLYFVEIWYSLGSFGIIFPVLVKDNLATQVHSGHLPLESVEFQQILAYISFCFDHPICTTRLNVQGD